MFQVGSDMVIPISNPYSFPVAPNFGHGVVIPLILQQFPWRFDEFSEIESDGYPSVAVNAEVRWKRKPTSFARISVKKITQRVYSK